MKDKLIDLKNRTISFIRNAGNIIKQTFSTMKAFFKKSFVVGKKLVVGIGLTVFVSVVLIIALVFSGVISVKGEEESPQVITQYFVGEKLNAIAEINTFECVYTIDEVLEEPRRILGLDIPLTTKSINMICDVTVKVGYDFTEFNSFSVANKLVVIDLPEQQVTNYISKEIIKDEDNNIFNPIKGEDYLALQSLALSRGLDKAEADGIHVKAETECKRIIKESFDKLGCTVQFI